MKKPGKPMDAKLTANLSVNKYEGKETVDFTAIPDGFRVVTIGSGAPTMNLYRGAPSTLVQYRDKYFLVDCGYGTCRTMYELGLDITDVTNLLITHQHEDHNADFSHFLMDGSFRGMNPRPYMNLVAPYGRLIFDKTCEIYAEDIAGRQGFGSLSLEQVRGLTKIYDLCTDTYCVELDGVKIEALRVIHGNMTSYSYKFTAGGQCVAVSGDVAYREDLAKFYQGADVLVAEAATMTGYFANFSREILATRMAGTHILENELAEVLVKASPRKVVLTHVIKDFIDFETTARTFREAGYQGVVLGAYDGLAVEP